jgi:hypothetical protein
MNNKHQINQMEGIASIDLFVVPTIAGIGKGALPNDPSYRPEVAASSVGGRVRPSILAVEALMTSSNLVDCPLCLSLGMLPRSTEIPVPAMAGFSSMA